MTTYAADDLKKILDLHGKWWRGEAGGDRANLDGASLDGASLVGANLDGANLVRASLDGANLDGARLSDGVLWADYLSEIVPALCVAGGKSLADVATEEHWNCHQWGSDGKALGCPMAVAFDAKSLDEIPKLHRWQASRFIQFFDAHLIPLPVIPAAPEGGETTK